MLFDGFGQLRRYAFEEAPKDGLLLEFGVFKGKSINGFAAIMDELGDKRTIYGFDDLERSRSIGRARNHQRRTVLISAAAFQKSSECFAVPADQDTLPAFLTSTSAVLPCFT